LVFYFKSVFFACPTISILPFFEKENAIFNDREKIQKVGALAPKRDTLDGVCVSVPV
jgi:hypothetical protein